MQITKVSVRKKHANYVMINICQKNVEHSNKGGAETCTKRISSNQKRDNKITDDTHNTKT